MIKYKVSVIFTLIIFALITYFTLNSSLRRSVFTKFIGAYKLYQTHIISSHIFYRDFSRASEQILNYIEFTQKISKGKNSMLQEIVDVTELVTSKIYTQDEFNEMEGVYIKINEISEDIYKNHIWLARSLSDNRPSQSIKHLNQALRLSKSSEETYREIIRLFSKDKKLTNLMNNYCMNYSTNFGGGSVDRIGAQDEKNFFMGSNSIFAISRDKKSPKNFSLKYGKYYNIRDQKKTKIDFAKICPLNSYARKNIGYLLAIKNKTEVIIETDDDNYPKKNFFTTPKLIHKVSEITNKNWVNI